MTENPASPDGRLARFVARAARSSARRPKRVIALWIALVLTCTAAGSLTGARALTDSGSNVGEAARAARVLRRAGLQPAATETILVRATSAERATAAGAELAAHVRGLDVVRAVRTPASTPSLVTDRGRTRLLVVSLRGDPDDADRHVLPLVRLVSRMRRRLPGVRVQEAGDASTDHAVSGLVDRGLRHAEAISVPFTLLILVLVFGALVAASVPLLLGITSVAAAMGAVAAISPLVPEGSSTGPVVLLIGLAVGVDYSLFAIRRVRAERRAGAGAQAALDATAATVGRAILVAGATVIIGLLGLLGAGFAVFTSLALGAIIVVAIAVLGSLTVLPALLTLLGERIDRPLGWRLRRRLGARRSRRARGSVRRDDTGASRGVWLRIGARVTAHARVALMLALGGLAALAAPALSLRAGPDDASVLPVHTPAILAGDAVNRAFPGAGDIETLVVSGRDLGSARARASLAGIGERGRALVAGHGPVLIRVSRDGSVAAIALPVPSATRALATRNVEALRRTLKPAAADALPGATAQLTGDDADDVDFTHRLSTVTPLVIAFVLGLAFVLVVATFGSPWLAAGVMGLNLLSVGAAFGTLVLVFQHSWAQSLLGFRSNGAIVNWLPLFAFVVLFGLSMDYTVLVLERAAESRRAGASPAAAAAESLGATGSAISSAALVMVAAFAVFATLPMLDFKQMGVGLASAIALDATLVRAVALPATLTLLGERGLRRPRGRRPGAPRAARRPLSAGVAWDHDGRATAIGAGHE